MADEKTDDCVSWCTACGARFSAADIVGAKCCPKCGSKSVPCDPKKDYLIEVNWHELRILGIWASNWAEKCDTQASASLRGILSRLERQVPGEAPLTLGGEMREVRKYLADHGGRLESINVPSEGFSLVNGPGAVGFAKKPGADLTAAGAPEVSDD